MDGSQLAFAAPRAGNALINQSSFLNASAAGVVDALNDHSSHPNFGYLAILVCEAVLMVVLVGAPGYIAASSGKFGAEAQKSVASLNINYFTPCLIFSKLASQLSHEKFTELWIIPVILLIQTLISYGSASMMTRIFNIRKQPQKNFVIAMAVFGNSNSLPLSLVISLSHTISGLHWWKIPDDSDNEVAARGILYLLIFSQLGQALRWSWGMNTLLRPINTYSPGERGEITSSDSESLSSYHDDPAERRPDSSEGVSENTLIDPGNPTGDPLAKQASNSSEAEGDARQRRLTRLPNGDLGVRDNADQPPLPIESTVHAKTVATRRRRKSFVGRVNERINTWIDSTRNQISESCAKAFKSLPTPLQSVLNRIWRVISVVLFRMYDALNVPLMAIIISVVVGSVPPLKAFFFTPKTFVNNTFTSAVKMLGNLAVPIILFVLGGNLCRATLPDEKEDRNSTARERFHMLWVSMVSRMVIPFVVMAPVLALIAKYVPVSILDDPIFIIVCFLLAGAPSALQLAQIAQVNEVFVPVISKILFHSYVVWIFPSTLVLVLLAIEVLEWAAQ